MRHQRVLITGAGTGFGREIALGLAAAGHQVIAAVEITAQVQSLHDAAVKRGLQLQVEKLDVTVAADRRRAEAWEVDVLLNNAGISEGGSVLDIPEPQLQRQFDVNVIGPILLTQLVVRGMLARKRGRVVFMSSVAGLTVDPFTGAYSGSKHAVEAFAEALRAEVAEFGIEVATINPGPFLTGFNDRMFETWTYWQDDPSQRVFDYSKLAFPHEQYDPAPVIRTAIEVLVGENPLYRHVIPAQLAEQVKQQQSEVWSRKVADGVGAKPELVRKAYQIKPATPAQS